MTFQKKDATIPLSPKIEDDMPQHPELVYWLALINESGLKLSRIKPIIQRWCVVEKRALAELFALTPLDWSTTFGLSQKEAEQAQLARHKLNRPAARLAVWQADGIETLIRTDPRYPKRLTYTLAPVQQPLVLWARGGLELLNEPGVAILGEQAPDDEVTRLMEELSRELAAEGIGLVSGYGRGLDRVTFETMLAAAGGHATAVLPMGLSAFAQTTSRLNRVVESGQVVLVSPFPPDTLFQEKLADARNLLIDYLALALLIPHTDDAAQKRATEALSRGVPVFVGLTDTAAHRTMIDQGAMLLTDAGEVVEMVQQAIIDDALQEPVAEVVSPPPVPSPQSIAASEEDYALRLEEVEPIDSNEALEILSLGGEIPEILRQRLQKPEEDV